MLFATEWTDVAMTFITVVLVPLVGWVIREQWKAKQEAAATKSILNGRMDDLLKAERERSYAAGHAAGVATVSAAIAESPQVSMDAQGVSQAVAKTLGESALRPKPGAN